jgi:serine O-acetyltransferase
MANQTNFRETLIADLQAAHIPIAANVGVAALIKHSVFALITKHTFACVFHFRLNVALGRRFPRLAALYAVQRYYMFANDISHHAKIGPGLRLHHTSDIVIGRRVVIGSRCHIYNGVTLGSKSMDRDEMPTIGDGVLIGTGAKVLGPVSVGDSATIGALTFCDKDVPANAVAVGNPMRFLNNTNA